MFVKCKKYAAFLPLIAAAVLLSACGAARDISAPIDTQNEAASDFTCTAPSNEAVAAEILSVITVDGVPLYQGEFIGDSFFADGARIVLYSEEPTTYTITGSLSIPRDCTLTVKYGSTLTFAPEAALTVEDGGTLLNRGIILVPAGDDTAVTGPGGEIIDGGEIVVLGALENVGEIINDGVIRVRDKGSVFTNGTYRGGALVEDGTFTNLGSLIIGTSAFTVHGELVNDQVTEEDPDGGVLNPVAAGEIHIEEGGNLSISKTGSFINNGVLNNGENNRLNDGTSGATAVKGDEIIVYGVLTSGRATAFTFL